jgi:fatty acid desaturase
MRSRGRALWSLPWALALVGLAVPMIGSGFIGWPFVVGWLVLTLVIWWVRPLGGADRTARLAVGVFVVGVLALLSTLGGFYLIPAVLLWLVLVAREPAQSLSGGQSVRYPDRHG